MLNAVGERRIEWATSATLEERLEDWRRDASSASRLVKDEPLSRRSSLRIGGPASRWIEVGRVDDLWSLLEALSGEEFHCVGLGSNVVFPDEGIESPVIRLVDELAGWSVHPHRGSEAAAVEVMAGAVNAHLVRGLLADGWVGAEFLTLIPGTFGGGVALNAGTKECELNEILESVWLAIPDDDQRCWRIEEQSPRALSMRYRHASLPTGSMVVGGVLEVQRGDVEKARQRMAADKRRRNETQPYRLASVGSTFANPEGDFAGRLIDEAGLKGRAVGGARISELHANFFINDSEATAGDFLRLMAIARHRVRRDFGIELRPEVRFVGFDGRRRLRQLERQLEGSDV